MSTTHERLPAATEQALGALLVQEGLLSAAQLLGAQQYAWEHRLDLRQAILKLKLVPAETVEKILADRVPALEPVAPAEGSPGLPAYPPAVVTETLAVAVVDSSGGVPAAVEPVPPLPLDRLKQEKDIKNDLKEIAESASPPDLVTQIFQRALEARATDVHFDPQDRGCRIRFRIDGQLHEVLELQKDMAVSLVSRMKVMANLNIVERRHAQDGRISIRLDQYNRDLRIATFPTILGEKVVVRIHEALHEALSFDQLGLSDRQAEQLRNLCSKPYGAVLVAGPVGAGKTTTLYSCLSRVNIPTRNLLTIEDPIEFRLPGVNQSQVDSKHENSFTEGLKAMLRQDPDVIMIGEIRDEETAHIGIRAAMTGVLVFSTIHASDCPSTIGNLYDFKIPGYLLSNTLLGVVSQRLLRRVCPYCRVQFEPDESQRQVLGLGPDDLPGLMLNQGQGCPACFQTGYLGRVGVYEIMEIGEILRELIFQQISKDVLRRVAIELGMQTLKQSALEKVIEGYTTIDEVYRVIAM